MQVLKNKYLNIELPYDNILHREVQSKHYIITPVGYKATLWFTFLGSKNVAVLTTYDRRNKIYKQQIITLCFDSCLSSGTLIQGTFFICNHIKCFTCEKAILYRNHKVSMQASTLKCIDIVKNYISQKIYNSQFMLVALPLVTTSLKKAASLSLSLPYRVQYVRLVDNNIVTNKIMKLPRTGVTIFQVSADTNHDIYHLHCKIRNKSDIVYYGTAAIQSYITSVKLNKIFRTIKENDNLDLLEESDSEDEFQDVSQDKYVDLSKKILMRCEYRPRFKKWEPIETVASSLFISSIDTIRKLER